MKCQSPVPTIVSILATQNMYWGGLEVKDDMVFHLGGGDPIILHCYLFEEADRLIKNESIPFQICSDYSAILLVLFEAELYWRS